MKNVFLNELEKEKECFIENFKTILSQQNENKYNGRFPFINRKGDTIELFFDIKTNEKERFFKEEKTTKILNFEIPVFVEIETKVDVVEVKDFENLRIRKTFIFRDAKKGIFKLKKNKKSVNIKTKITKEEMVFFCHYIIKLFNSKAKKLKAKIKKEEIIITADLDTTNELYDVLTIFEAK